MSEGNAISKQVGGNNPRVDQSEFSSRLDRLLSLLENASSPVTRAEAARQLGEVQQKYPTELNALLSLGLKSCTQKACMHSASWESARKNDFDDF